MHFDIERSNGTYGSDLGALRCHLAREFPERPVVARSRFVMAEHFAEQVLENRKLTTIRYDRHAVEYPCGEILPLYALKEGHAHDQARHLAALQIVAVRYTSLGGLTEQDARDDGFGSREELLGTLQHFYGTIGTDETVCVYSFRLVEHVGADASQPRPETAA